MGKRSNWNGGFGPDHVITKAMDFLIEWLGILGGG
jgi:hypothetical protein